MYKMILNSSTKIERNKELFTLFIIALIVFLFTAPLLKNPFNISKNTDWNQIYSYFYFARNTIIHQLQFPLRCPYFGGGYPLIANPQDLSLSPLFLLILVFGEILGTKIICVLTYFICAFGMYYLTRGVLKFNRLGALFSSLSLTLSSWLPQQLSNGNFTKIYYCLLPLLVAFILQSKSQRKFIIYSSFLLTTILFQAGLSFAAICLFLFIFFTFYPAGEKRILNFGLVMRYTLALISSLLIGAVKLIPLIELLKNNGRNVDYYFVQNFSFNIRSLLKALTEKNYYTHSTIYLGYATIFLALFAFIFDFKKIRGIFFALAIVLAILFGPNSIINLSSLIWRMPIFHSMYKLDKYYSFFVAFLLSLTAGYAFGILRERLHIKLFLVLALLIIIFNTFDIFVNNITFHKNIFTSMPFSEENKMEFSQAEIVNNNKERDAAAYLQYRLLKQNVGIINWYGNIYLPESTIPKYLISVVSETMPLPIRIDINPGYRGELFFTDNSGNRAEFTEFSPNKIEIKTRLSSPDTLVINQNFDPSWKIRGGKITSRNGLLAIKIDQPGEYNLKLTYLPLTFFIGISISIISIIICGFVLNISKKILVR